MHVFSRSFIAGACLRQETEFKVYCKKIDEKKRLDCKTDSASKLFQMNDRVRDIVS